MLAQQKLQHPTASLGGSSMACIQNVSHYDRSKCCNEVAVRRNALLVHHPLAFHCDTGGIMPLGPSSTSLFAYILHTTSVLAAVQAVCRCLQVWNAQDAEDEVLVMVVRCP